MTSSQMDVDYEDSASDGGDGDTVFSFDSVVNNAVIYIASVDESRFPIKRGDITKHALPPKSGKQFNNVMRAAKTLLEEVFGLMLVELEGKEKSYMTISKFTNPQSMKLFQFSTEHRRKRALLLIVLSYVYMMDNSVVEEKLWKYLKRLKLVDNTLSYVHEHFGNVRRICTTDFVRNMYLKMEKSPGSNPQENLFMWGPRADIEFSKLEILKFVGLMQSNVGPEKFTAQWSKLQPEQDDEASDDEVPPKQPVKRSVAAPMKSSQKRRKK